MLNTITTTGTLENGVVIPKMRPKFEITKILLTFWPKIDKNTDAKKEALKKIINSNLSVSENWAENKQQISSLHDPF